MEPATPVTPGMISSLSRARPWVLSLALYGFLWMALAGVAAYISLVQLHRPLASAIQGGIAMACLLGALRLVPFARALKRIRQGAGVAPVEEALEHQLKCLRSFGIDLLFVLAVLALVALAGYALLLQLVPSRSPGPPPAFASIDEACSARSTDFVCGTVALFDPQGKLLFWTGWQTFTPQDGVLRPHPSSRDNGVSVLFAADLVNVWEVRVRPPRGRALRRGEYTGANSGATEAGGLVVRSPPARFPDWSGRKEPEWQGDCRQPGDVQRRDSGGRFTVREILWTPTGDARRISLDFMQPCAVREGTWLVLGRVRATLPGA